MTTAETKVAWIETQLAAGLTVYLATRTRITKITARNAKKFAAAGRPIVKADASGSALLMWEAGSYVDASYSRLTAS